MPDDTTSTQKSTDDKTTQQGAPPQPPPDQKASDAISKDEATKLIEKARTEEKNKLYPELQRLKGEREEKDKELSKLKAESEELRNKLKLNQDTTLTEQQKLEQRMSDLEARIKKADTEKGEIATMANQKIADLELRLYREEKIRKAGIELIELVSGSTREEIDASVERARAREAELLGKARDRIREDVAKELGRTLPNDPAAPPDDSETKDRTPQLTPRQRSELSKIRDPQKYQETRTKMLAEAISRLPDGHPFKQTHP